MPSDVFLASDKNKQAFQVIAAQLNIASGLFAWQDYAPHRTMHGFQAAGFDQRQVCLCSRELGQSYWAFISINQCLIFI